MENIILYIVLILLVVVIYLLLHQVKYEDAEQIEKAIKEDVDKIKVLNK